MIYRIVSQITVRNNIKILRYGREKLLIQLETCPYIHRITTKKHLKGEIDEW